MAERDPQAEEDFQVIVPELLVTDLTESLDIYVRVFGFSVRFSRPEDGFAYLTLGRGELMLAQLTDTSWTPAPPARPFGRGINLQIDVEDAARLFAASRAASLTIYRDLQTRWYRENAIEHGQEEFIVQDLDGYLLRFARYLGTRPAR